jgi:hypothetical protein
LAAGAAWAVDIKSSATLPGLGQGPKIIKVLYDEVIFSAAKTPTKVTLMCTPTGLRPLSVECLINRSNLPQPVVVQPTQISIHDDSNDQRLAPTCTIIECHFPFPTVMKTCVGGVKVANVQFRLFHAPPAPSAPVLLDAFYKDGEMRHLPMVAYPHTKAKIQCWAIIIWYADKGPEYEQLTWAELAKRFAYFYTRQLNETMHPQSLRFLGEKLGVPNAGKESSKDEIVTFETYMQTRVGHWLYNAVQAIKSYHDLWKNYSLRMFLTHKDAVILLKQMGAKPGDFLFRIPSQLAEEDTKAFKTRSPSSTLVFTYVQKVGDELKFAKVDVNDKVREDPKFVHQKKELVNVLCLNEKGEMILRHKMDCAFNEKQKRKEHVVKSSVKSSGDDGDEYETY